MQRLTLGTWLRPLWRRPRLPAAMDGWYDSRLPNGVWVRYRVQGGWIVTAYAAMDGWYDSRLPNGVWVRYRVQGGWIVTAYATAGDDPGDALLAMWGEPEVVTTYLHRGTRASPSTVRMAIDRLLGRSKER
jgi:hypothetical protein